MNLVCTNNTNMHHYCGYCVKASVTMYSVMNFRSIDKELRDLPGTPHRLHLLMDLIAAPLLPNDCEKCTRSYCLVAQVFWLIAKKLSLFFYSYEPNIFNQVTHNICYAGNTNSSQWRTTSIHAYINTMRFE